jgi:hypothetical protein
VLRLSRHLLNVPRLNVHLLNVHLLNVHLLNVHLLNVHLLNVPRLNVPRLSVPRLNVHLLNGLPLVAVHPPLGEGKQKFTPVLLLSRDFRLVQFQSLLF